MDAVARLAGLQAQESTGPYVGLWSRLRDFRREELTRAIEERRLSLATLQRVTIHLVTADDHRWLKPTLAPVLERTRRRPALRDLDHDRVLAAARERLPARMPELHDLVRGAAERGYVNDYYQANLPLVRVPPAGTWGSSGSALQELVEVGEADVGQLVRRYLAAFGPATVRDAQAWSGLTRLREVLARLELVELGGGYVDLPDAPRPGADVDAPPRFLPRWDNVLIGYADRSRFGAPRIGEPAVLVDGVVAGSWRWTGDDVEVDVAAGQRRAIEDERVRLRDWLSDAAASSRP